jgi:outer membrane usher protein
MALLSATTGAIAEEKTAQIQYAAEWDPNMLKGIGANENIDLSRFNLGNPVLPGSYRADVYLNSQWLGRRTIKMIANRNNAKAPAVACIDKALFDLFGVDPLKVTPQGQKELTDSQTNPTSNACWEIEQLVPDSSSTYDPSEQILNISIAQANLRRQARGYVPPELWTQGVTAGTLAYQFNDFATHASANGAGSTTNSSYLGLNAGFNAGPWHFRETASLLAGSGQKTQFQQSQAYVGRDFPDIKSQMMVGNVYSDGQLLNSFSVIGATLMSDDRMYPDSERGFAPAIHGVALSNAKVQIRQNNIVIYDAVVPPGPFNITDLYPTGFGGDLVVSVTESDGSVRTFNVPFSAAPMSLREGRLRYSLVGGKLNHTSVHGDKFVAEGNVQYGQSNTWTLNGALLSASRYNAGLVGAAVNTDFGSVVSNLTFASYNKPSQGNQNGASVNAAWSKLFTGTNTNLSFAAYRYSSANFYTLQDAMSSLAAEQNGNSTYNPNRQRQQINMNVSQSFGRYGTLNFSGNSTNFWVNPNSAYNPGTLTGYSASYGFNTYGIGVSTSATRTYSSLAGSVPVNTISLGVNIPLNLGERNFSMVNGQVTHNSDSGTTEQANWSGSFGNLNEYSAGLSESHTSSKSSGASTSTLVNGSYRAPLALLSASAGTGSGHSQASFSASGGLIVHEGGVTFSPMMGDTMALVHVEDGEGIEIANFPSAPVDSNGYTIMPFLSPYQQNTVSLDLSKVSLQTSVENAYQQVAPHAGAVAMLNFTKAKGISVFIEVKLLDGKPAPFGATVLNEVGEQVGSVGQFGRIEARVEDRKGRLAIIWGDSADQTCLVSYALSAEKKDTIQNITATCRPVQPEAPTRVGMLKRVGNENLEGNKP